MPLIFVDCEAPMGVGSPATGNMTEFGAVEFKTRREFHGQNCSREVFECFRDWLRQFSDKRLIFVSDNVAYDWQWINFYFWKYFGENPFGHSGRRISDFYAGLCGDFYQTQRWKRLRRTVHDHNPVNDARGNAEAFERLINGER
jgi:hypothetical protein